MKVIIKGKELKKGQIIIYQDNLAKQYLVLEQLSRYEYRLLPLNKNQKKGR